MARASEFFTMDSEELESRLVESRRELLNLRFQLATGQLDNVAQIKAVRRDVARALTVLRAIEIAEAEGVTFEPPAERPERVSARRRDAERTALEPEPEPEPELDAAELDEEADEEEPILATRPRRARAVAPELDDVEPDVEEEAEEAEPASRARRSRAAVPVVEDTAVEDTAVEEENADPAPKARIRRTRRAEPEEAAPKRTRARRTRKAADAAEVDEEQP
jgi:large subunit ribosomal protein L29